mmetsp:Transcript_25699/g.81111  ORF Transcript_25699/g.81111 Transcript_25699/m.81111 type:complete len:233 (-) Transcript_25699:27-725(-)
MPLPTMQALQDSPTAWSSRRACRFRSGDSRTSCLTCCGFFWSGCAMSWQRQRQQRLLLMTRAGQNRVEGKSSWRSWTRSGRSCWRTTGTLPMRSRGPSPATMPRTCWCGGLGTCPSMWRSSPRRPSHSAHWPPSSGGPLAACSWRHSPTATSARPVPGARPGACTRPSAPWARSRWRRSRGGRSCGCRQGLRPSLSLILRLRTRRRRTAAPRTSTRSAPSTRTRAATLASLS